MKEATKYTDNCETKEMVLIQQVIDRLRSEDATQETKWRTEAAKGDLRWLGERFTEILQRLRERWPTSYRAGQPRDKTLLNKTRSWGGDHDDVHQTICCELLKWIKDCTPTKGEVADAFGMKRDATIDRVRQQLLSPKKSGRWFRDRGRGVAHKEKDSLERKKHLDVVDDLSDDQRSKFADACRAIDGRLPSWFCVDVVDYFRDPSQALALINEGRKAAKHKRVSDDRLVKEVKKAVDKNTRNQLALIYPARDLLKCKPRKRRAAAITSSPQVADQMTCRYDHWRSQIRQQQPICSRLWRPSLRCLQELENRQERAQSLAAAG